MEEEECPTRTGGAKSEEQSDTFGDLQPDL